MNLKANKTHFTFHLLLILNFFNYYNHCKFFSRTQLWQTEKNYSNEQFTYSLWSVSLFFSFFLFFVAGLFLFFFFFSSTMLQFFLCSFFFLLDFSSRVFEVLYSVSDSLFGRFYDRLFRLEITHVAWTGLRHQIVLCRIAVIHIQQYTYTYGNIVNTIMKNKHNSYEKYTSHTLFKLVAKGLRKGYVWEVSWRQNKLQHIDPQFLRL